MIVERGGPGGGGYSGEKSGWRDSREGVVGRG